MIPQHPGRVLLLCALSPLTTEVSALCGKNQVTPAAAANTTAANANLHTWWHDNGEVNYQTPAQDGNVRQSHLYSASVKSTAESNGT